jgi:protein Mpv17
MTLTGALLAIPVNTWYTRISYCFGTLPRAAAVALQVGLSQAIFTPFFLVAFFGVQGALEGRTVQEIRDKIMGTGPSAWRDGLMLWPAVSTVNFALVPLEYRALVGGVASLGWNTWLSYLNSRAGKVAAREAEEVVVTGGAPVVELKVGAAAATPA